MQHTAGHILSCGHISAHDFYACNLDAQGAFCLALQCARDVLHGQSRHTNIYWKVWWGNLYRRRGLQVLVAFCAGHSIEDAAVCLKDAMPQEAVVLKGLLMARLLLHD